MTSLLFPHSAFGISGACVFACCLLVSAFSDLRGRRIPNALNGVTAVVGLAFSVASLGFGRGAFAGIAGMATGFALWFPLFALGALGAGDVKLFAAAGAWLGPERVLVGSVIAALAGGALAIVWLVRLYGVAGTAAQLNAGAYRTRSTTDPRSPRAIPYGVALVIGAAGAAWLPRLLAGG